MKVFRTTASTRTEFHVFVFTERLIVNSTQTLTFC